MLFLTTIMAALVKICIFVLVDLVTQLWFDFNRFFCSAFFEAEDLGGSVSDKRI